MLCYSPKLLIFVLFCIISACLLHNPYAQGQGGLSSQDLETLLQDFRNQGYYTAASIFGFLGPSLLTPRITMLIPSDKAIAEAINELSPSTLLYPGILRYHMLERNLAFNQLQLLPVGTWLPSLLPGYGVQVTTNNPNNFTLNDAKIVTRDMCASMSRALLSCQGIDQLLNVSSTLGREPQNPPLFLAPAPAPS